VAENQDETLESYEPQGSSGPQMPVSESVPQQGEIQSEPLQPRPASSSRDQWRDYQAGDAPASTIPDEESNQDVEEHMARTVAEMAQAAGAESGQGTQSMPPSPDSGGEPPASFDAELAEEGMASAEEPEEKQGSRWSISRFTRSLSEF
jgi:hypothetical protein